jgi:hypothetical protein
LLGTEQDEQKRLKREKELLMKVTLILNNAMLQKKKRDKIKANEEKI